MKLKTLSLLLAISLSSPALAIGLGELSVRSYLGQPLHVTLEIIDPPASIDTACLSLHPAPNGLALPTHTRFELEQRNGRAVLHITTRERFAEPAAQFILMSDCDGRLQREYVLLLDPPPVTENVTVATPEALPKPAAVQPTVQSRAARSVRRPSAPTAASTATPKPRPSASAPQPRPNPSATPEAPAPRLVISGRSQPAAGLDGETSAGNPLPTIAELSDENTALLRKLAHIESQLVELNRRNAELEARLNTALPMPAAAATDAAPPWLAYSMVFLGLLAAGGGLLAWSQRRETASHTAFAAAPAGVRRSEPTTRPHAAPRSPAAADAEPDVDEFPPIAGAAGTEVREDAVDQAEVLAVHGYAGLAIQLLREHLRAAPSESPTPWLLLLDLLHREHDDAGYAAAAAELRRRFNVNFPERPSEALTGDQQGLLAYPHILDMLTQAWNTPALAGIFQNLIFDKRGGMRVGFDPVAYQDILLLRDIAESSAASGS